MIGTSNVNTIIAVILAILGIVLIVQNFLNNRRLANVENWYLTNATVVNAVAQPATPAAGHVPVDPSNITHIPDTTVRFIPRVVYKYTINGKEYQSNQIFYGGEPQLNSSEIGPFMDKFRVGTTIPIYYNPADAQQSYVVVSGHQNYWGIIFGVVLILLAFWALNYDKVKISSHGLDITSETPNLTEMGATTVTRTNNGATVGRLY